MELGVSCVSHHESSEFDLTKSLEDFLLTQRLALSVCLLWILMNSCRRFTNNAVDPQQLPQRFLHNTLREEEKKKVAEEQEDEEEEKEMRKEKEEEEEKKYVEEEERKIRWQKKKN